MFMAHATDAWTRDADRTGPVFYWRDIISGFGAPLFLLLAGVAIAYSAAARMRRGDPPAASARIVANRGWQIFGLALLFRVQMYVTGGFYRWRSLLKVDILNVMGPSIAGAAYLWGLARSTAGRTLLLAGATAAIVIGTPYIRGVDALAALPDALERYIRPVPDGQGHFVLFPWAAFVFAGAAIGVILEAARDARSERGRVWMLTAAGVVMAAASYALSFLPSPFPNTFFWTTSPAFFFLRMGIMLAAFGAAFVWSEQLFAGRWQPLVLLGQTSLFVYWVHVEIVYGYLTKAIYHRLPLWASGVGTLALTVLMYYLARNGRAWVARRRSEGLDDWRTRALGLLGL